MKAKPVLQVQNLRTYYKILRGYVRAVENVSFDVKQGEALGLAGESGCGKTTIALSILKILPPGGFIAGGKILVDGINIPALDEYEMRMNVRWKKIAIIFQGAMNALNPVYRISEQIVEAITLHEPGVEVSEARERAMKLFELVGIEPSRIDNYPHEFSGGMRQRAMIAMALACNPKLLIADEPGTALDVIVQAQVLKLMKELKEKLNLSMIMITHDLSIITETCERTAIMYAGKIVELGTVKTIFKEPLHPYTQGLIGAFPELKAPRMRMVSIPGSPPDLLRPPPGCRFHPRCPYAMEICKTKEPEFTNLGKEHFVACHLVQKK
ncbi:ABC transporter ATP-binding protein [Candidatus Bathyarchaeota archaeon]|nr:MAG: ABC transporter ATP-binding protein [Candidatus Bathyarchaeota archaeon]